VEEKEMEKIIAFIKSSAFFVVLGIGAIVALITIGGALEGVEKALSPLAGYFGVVLGVIVVIGMTLASGYLVVIGVIDLFRKKKSKSEIGLLGMCFYGAAFAFFVIAFWLKWLKNLSW
jgi:hypothetical protein